MDNSRSRFQIEALDASFGAVITGLKLSTIDDASFAEIHAAWLEYALLIFPDQHLTNQEQVVFAKRFGDLEGGGDTGTQPGTGYDESDVDVKVEHWLEELERLVPTDN